MAGGRGKGRAGGYAESAGWDVSEEHQEVIDTRDMAAVQAEAVIVDSE